MYNMLYYLLKGPSLVAIVITVLLIYSNININNNKYVIFVINRCIKLL